MTELWTTLIPIALITAVMPGQVAITILMLRVPGGVARAGAWVGGMTVVRLAQFALLFLVLEPATDDGEPGTSLVEGALLLVVAILLLVSAARKLVNQPDEDARRRPGWPWSRVESITRIPHRRRAGRPQPEALGVHARRHRRDRGRGADARRWLAGVHRVRRALAGRPPGGPHARRHRTTARRRRPRQRGRRARTPQPVADDRAERSLRDRFLLKAVRAFGIL